MLAHGSKFWELGTMSSTHAEVRWRFLGPWNRKYLRLTSADRSGGGSRDPGTWNISRFVDSFSLCSSGTFLGTRQPNSRNGVLVKRGSLPRSMSTSLTICQSISCDGKPIINGGNGIEPIINVSEGIGLIINNVNLMHGVPWPMGVGNNVEPITNLKPIYLTQYLTQEPQYRTFHQ